MLFSSTKQVVVLLLRFEYLIDHIALRSRSLLIVKKPLRYPNHISITFPNFIMRASSIAALSTILSLATVQAQSTSENNCTVFTWDQQPAYYIYGPPERISGATTCAPRNNESHYCALKADGDIQVQYSKNVTSLRDSCWNTPDGVTCFLESIIKPAVNASLNGEPWSNSVIGAIDNWESIEPGESAYLNFTTLKRCFVGTMSNCTGNLTDGLALEACAPVWHTVGTSQRAIMDGEVIVVNISEADVGNFRDPFANQVSGEEAAAGRFVVGGNVLGIALAVAFAAVLV